MGCCRILKTHLYLPPPPALLSLASLAGGGYKRGWKKRKRISDSPICLSGMEFTRGAGEMWYINRSMIQVRKKHENCFKHGWALFPWSSSALLGYVDESGEFRTRSPLYLWLFPRSFSLRLELMSFTFPQLGIDRPSARDTKSPPAEIL